MVNDLPIRMYGLVPVSVEDKETVLHPEIAVPDEVRPGEKYMVKVSEDDGRPMTYTLAVVDEGLLDLTRCRTPVPHKYFYKREALSVKTWDLYDYVLGAFGGRLEKVFAIGGDMEAASEEDKKKANRFKPVVTFLGPFKLAAGETKTHTIQMPNYIGSVRCMVVAGQDGAYGNTDKTFPVRQPLMVLGTLPRVLAPGELARLPVSIFVMDENIRKVTVEIETNDVFHVERASREIEVDGPGEHRAYFDLSVEEVEGVGTVKVKVSSGDEEAKYEMELQVRNPNQRMYDVNHHLVKANESWGYEPEFSGTSGTNELNIMVSSTPSLNLEKRMKYLIRYPYGCIEQTTSSVFPQLYLDQLLNLDPEMKQKIETNIRMGISRINKFALSNGAFSYWPGSSRASDWSTSYAGHFLLLAREKGYHVPAGLINNWISYQRDMANNWQRRPWDELSQAYRLYTLALAGKPNVSAMNRLREEENLGASAKYRLAAAYALLGQKKVAVELIRNLEAIPEESETAWRNNYGSATRDLSMILETYLLLDDKEEAYPLFRQIATSLRSDEWMSTQTTAFALYAASLFVNESEDGSYRFSYSWNGDGSGEIRGESTFFSADLEVARSNNLQVKNLTDKELYVTTTISGIPVMDAPIDVQSNMAMEIRYYNMQGEVIDATSIPHGMDFYAEVLVQNGPGYGYQNNFALSQIFPSGWEIINTRMLDVSANLVSDNSDFVDFRDDRVNTFFDLNSSQTKRFIVLLNAAYQGRFFLPATKCGPMYNNEVSSSIGGGWVEVRR
jgi:uncharacterized protein YfaS (alpha-2-macroglobulin family)